MENDIYHWSGKINKRRNDLNYGIDLIEDVKRQVDNASDWLGRGNFGTVKRITVKSCSRTEIAVARKQLRLDPKFDLAAIAVFARPRSRTTCKVHLPLV